MARKGLLASATSFTHLLGFGASSRAEKEDEDEKKDDEGKRGKVEEKSDEDEDDRDDKERKSKSEKEDKNEDEDEDRDEDDEDDEKDAKRCAARRRERARCAAIFASPHAAARPDMAAHYAFATNMTRSEAVSALAAVAAGGSKSAARGGFRQRMDRERSPDLGADAPRADKADTPDAAARACLAAAGLLTKT